MTRWWPSLNSPHCFKSRPWGEWFLASRPGETSHHPCEWPTGDYWFYKIYPSDGHREQLAFRPLVDKYYKRCWADSNTVQYKKDQIYIITYPGDTPNWGSAATIINIGPPCSNWKSYLYTVPYTVRTQSWEILAAVQADRTLESSVETAIAKTGLLELSAVSAVQANFDIELDMDAVIQGDADQTFLARAAVRTERTLEDSIVSAVATEFGDTVDVETAIQGNPFETVRIDAAILGETEIEVTIKTTIVKDRTEAIMLELENTWPQEFHFVSIPNWRSRAKDYRIDSIGG